jgi:hypothetical protein
MSKIWKVLGAVMFITAITLTGCEKAEEAPANTTENAGGMGDLKPE